MDHEALFRREFGGLHAEGRYRLVDAVLEALRRQCALAPQVA